MELILLLIVGIFVYAFVKAKVRMAHANQMRAMRDLLEGSGRAPSWVNNLDRREEFLYTIERLAIRKSVPPAYIREALGDKEMFKTFVHYAGALEKHKASFAEQKVAVAELIVKLWAKLGGDQKEAFTRRTSTT